MRPKMYAWPTIRIYNRILRSRARAPSRCAPESASVPTQMLLFAMPVHFIRDRISQSESTQQERECYPRRGVQLWIYYRGYKTQILRRMFVRSFLYPSRIASRCSAVYFGITLYIIEAIRDLRDTPYAADRRQICPTMAISPLALASRLISSLSIG